MPPVDDETPAPERPAPRGLMRPARDRPWRDRRGRAHVEHSPERAREDVRADRVPSALELAWAAASASDRDALVRAAMARPNPLIDPDPEPGMARWTWVVEAPDARAVALWTNPVFDHVDPAASEFTRLPGSDVWVMTLRLPASLRASYRVARWREDGPPPWRTATGRRPVVLAAMRASEADERCPEEVRGSWGEVSSVASGPAAPAERWRDASASVASRTDLLDLGGGERAWVYAPATDAPTPLLVLFDGQVWHGMGLGDALDRLIGAGALPPLHVAMLDSHDTDTRWDRLGVPGGQVDTVVDALLPRVRSGWPVRGDGAGTLVSGQSLGGLASVWTLALSGGEVGHAIAQSASLWRFDVADALLDEPGWSSLVLQAGTFEGDMLPTAQAFAARVQGDPRRAGRRVVAEPVTAGHDWAAWRATLLHTLTAAQGPLGT